MTPAVQLLKKQKVAFQLHAYEQDPSVASYGLEAAEKIGVPAEQVFKTLVAVLDHQQLIVALLPVNQQLNLKQLAKAAGAKKAALAPPEQVERVTGYVLGGVSPLGQKKRLTTLLDLSAEGLEQIYVSAGKRGLDIQLAPSDLRALTHASWAHLT